MAQVKSYKRRTKNGKIVTVKAHSRKGDKKSSEVSGKVRGNELKSMKIENYIDNLSPNDFKDLVDTLEEYADTNLWEKTKSGHIGVKRQKVVSLIREEAAHSGEGPNRNPMDFVMKSLMKGKSKTPLTSKQADKKYARYDEKTLKKVQDRVRSK